MLLQYTLSRIRDILICLFKAIKGMPLVILYKARVTK